MEEQSIAFTGWLIRKQLETGSITSPKSTIYIAEESPPDKITTESYEIITIQQIATFLSLSSNTIVRAIYDREFPLPISIIDETVMASKSELLEYINHRFANCQNNIIRNPPILLSRPKGAKYDAYASDLIVHEKMRRDPDNLFMLQVQCAKCQQWFTPGLNSVKKRIAYIYAGIGNKTNFQHQFKKCPSLHSDSKNPTLPRDVSSK